MNLCIGFLIDQIEPQVSFPELKRHRNVKAVVIIYDLSEYFKIRKAMRDGGGVHLLIKFSNQLEPVIINWEGEHAGYSQHVLLQFHHVNLQIDSAGNKHRLSVKQQSDLIV